MEVHYQTVSKNMDIQEQDSLRYGRVRDILNLAILMQVSCEGLSLNDIQEKFEVSRRTAERMKDAVIETFPSVEEVRTAKNIKRWRINRGATNNFIKFTAEEIAELENYKKLLEEQGLKGNAKNVDNTITKIKALMYSGLSKIETDLEALLEAEGYAIRQHPKYKIDKSLLDQIRISVKACKIVEISYKTKDKEELSISRIYPYGILYGSKNYLVAYSEKRAGFRLYILSSIKEFKILEEYFDRNENFNLSEYASRSFGVFQEEPFDVVWQFSSEVAEDVKNFHFHPSQKLTGQKDGSVIVEFRAGDGLTMCWHLFTWGNKVKIIKPKKLQDKYNQLLEEVNTQELGIN